MKPFPNRRTDLSRIDLNRRTYQQMKMSRWKSLENVGRGGPSMAGLMEGFVGNIPGVYAIYADGFLIYIGSTKTLKIRMWSHIRQQLAGGRVLTRWGIFESVTVKISVCTTFDQARRRETKLLHRLRPPYNEFIPSLDAYKL